MIALSLLLSITLTLYITCTLNRRIQRLQNMSKLYYKLFVKATQELDGVLESYADLALDYKSLIQFDGKE